VKSLGSDERPNGRGGVPRAGRVSEVGLVRQEGKGFMATKRGMPRC